MREKIVFGAIVSFAFFATITNARADACRPMEFAELESMSPQELKEYYVRLGDIKESWWHAMNEVGSDAALAQSHECDLEADRVQRLAQRLGMAVFDLMTAGAHTGLLGTGSARPSGQTEQHTQSQIKGWGFKIQ